MREQDKIADAQDAFERALVLEPENVQVVQQLVELDILNKDFNSASERVRRHREKASDSAAAEFLEGTIYAAQDQRDRAKAALLRALQLDPSFSSASELLISTYIASNQLTEALGQLQGILSKNPDNVRLLMSEFERVMPMLIDQPIPDLVEETKSGSDIQACVASRCVAAIGGPGHTESNRLNFTCHKRRPFPSGPRVHFLAVRRDRTTSSFRHNPPRVE